MSGALPSALALAESRALSWVRSAIWRSANLSTGRSSSRAARSGRRTCGAGSSPETVPAANQIADVFQPAVGGRAGWRRCHADRRHGAALLHRSRPPPRDADLLTAHNFVSFAMLRPAGEPILDESHRIRSCLHSPRGVGTRSRHLPKVAPRAAQPGQRRRSHRHLRIKRSTVDRVGTALGSRRRLRCRTRRSAWRPTPRSCSPRIHSRCCWS